MVKEAFKRVTSYINPTGIPGADFAVNPYVGCPHKCAYCYADFMKRFTNHHEPWGEFLDVKICDKPIDVKKYAGKSILIVKMSQPYKQVLQVLFPFLFLHFFISFLLVSRLTYNMAIS